MSDSPAPGHDDHAPAPAEFSHPLLWTVGLIVACSFLLWLFFHCMSLGNVAARGEPQIKEIMPQVGGGEPEPDHEALTKDYAPDFLAQGQRIFAKNCASCHGMQGDLVGGSNAQARNFHSDPFKNPNGGGPYALYLVVSHGFNAMPAFPGLAPIDRYAAVQYIRTAFVKRYDPKNYVEEDPIDLQETMPKPGLAATGPLLPPNERPTPALLYPLMQADADRSVAAITTQNLWLDTMDRAATDDTSVDINRFHVLVSQNRGLGEALYEAAKADNKATFIQLVLGTEVPGAHTSAFDLMPASRLDTLYQAAHAATAGGQ